MRLSYVFCLVAGLAGGCQMNSRSAHLTSDSMVLSEQGASVRDFAAIKLYVKGMSCPLCANNIDKQLLRVPGVRQVSVDLGSGLVLVTTETSRLPTRDQLTAAIAQSGFTLDRIEMPTPQEGLP